MGNENKKLWYVVSTQSGQESKVKQNIDTRIKTMNMEDYIFQTIVAEEDVPVIRNGKETGKTRKKNIYPRYLFVEMKMSDEAWYVIRNTPGVTGFVGSSGKGTKPTPVPQEQIDTVLKMMGIINKEVYSKYAIGDEVRIIRGTYKDNQGIITAIDKENNLVTINIFMLGRQTPAHIPFSDVAKI